MSEQALRVLLVDDEASLREPLAKFLRGNYNYQVDTAANGEEAWQSLIRSPKPYHVALIDDLLAPSVKEEPRPLGIELLGKIRAYCPQTEVIIFTGWGMERALDALRAGAFRYLAKPFNRDELAILIRHAAEYQQLKGAAHEKQILERLMESGAALLAGHLEGVLDRVVQGIQAIGFDRVRLYLLTEDKQFTVGKAHAGMDKGFLNLTRPVIEDHYLRLLLRDPRAQVFQREEGKPVPFEEQLSKQGVDQWACVPLLLRGEMIGKLSVDNKFSGRPIAEEDLKPVALFASLAAAAIENARLFQKAGEERDRVELLYTVSRQLSDSDSDLPMLLQEIISLATNSIRATEGTLFVLGEEGRLRYWRSVGLPPRAEQTVQAIFEKGLASWVMKNGESAILPDFRSDPRWLTSPNDMLKEGSALGVPLKYGSTVLGVITLTNSRVSFFTDEHRLLLESIANQAAIAIQHAALFQKTKQRAEELEALRHTTLAITSPLDRDTLLCNIVEQAVELLGAKSGGLYEYYPERGELTVIADHNRPDNLSKTLKLGESMAGRLVQSGEAFMIVDDYDNWTGRAQMHVEIRPFGAVLEVPLKWQDRTVGVQYVDDQVGRKFTPEDARLLGLFADQAAIALANADLITKNEEKLRRLERLSKATKEIMGNLGSMTLDELLTLIAKHATEILEAEACGVHLVKREGFLSLEASYGHREGSFQKGLEFAICSGPKTGLTGHIAYEGKLLNAHGDTLTNHFAVRGVKPSHLPSGECYSLLAIPLKKKEGETEKLVGLLRAENKKQNGRTLPGLSFTKEDEWILNIFAEAVVVALDSAKLVGQLNEQKDHLELLLKASNTLAQAENLTEGLQSLAEMVVSLLTHTFCRILLLDESGGFLAVKAAYPIPRSGSRLSWEPGLEQHSAASEWQGLHRLLEAGAPTVLRWSDEQVRPVLVRFSRWLDLEEDIQSLLMVPLKMGTRGVGLLEVGEARGEERGRFTDAEIELASAIAAETTALIDRMRLYEITERRKAEVERLQHAAQAMTGAFDLTQVLQAIVECTKDMLHADSCAIWSYDHIRDKFIPEELASIGIPDEELQRFREEEQRPGRTTYAVMERDWIGVTDASSPESEFLGQRTRELLQRTGMKSFQGIALRVGDEPLGVLYVNYRQPHALGEEDRRPLENLATYAALSLKKARLLDQVRKAKQAAEVVAQVTALGDLRATLASVTQGTQEAVGCDAVVLFVYDQITGKLDYPPTMVGVRYPDRVARSQELEPISIPSEMLRRDGPYIVEKVDNDPLFRGRRFAREEGIESCVAIPLKAYGQKVGVMFVNYRARHRFTTDELTNIELFANQAAVAIRNAQLFGQVQGKVSALQTLYEAGRAITGTLELSDILSRIAEQAWNLTGQGSYTSIRLVEDMKARVVASYPQEELDKTRAVLGEEIDLRMGINGRIAVEGRTILTGESQLVGDVTRDSDYLESHPSTRSELVAPMKVGGQVVGVISVEHPNLNAFDEEDRRTLESLAAQAAVAIRNAQLHGETKKRADALRALYEAGKTISGSLTLEETLKRITEQALRIVGGRPSQEGCFSHLALLEGTKLRFVAASGPEILSELQRKVEEIELATSQWVGITGQAVETGQSQNVGDISRDSDYTSFAPHINSQLSVPIKIGEQVIGVLSIERPELYAFASEEQQNIELLAAQAAVAIENARRYEALEKTKEALAARTALAWTGMVSSTWRHTIEKHAITIREQIQLLRRDLAQLPKTDSLGKRLEMIERLASQILEKPITPPLSVEEEVHSVSVNDLICERTKQLWVHEPYRYVSLTLNLGLDDSATVRASPEWLRRALDILIDNALEATAGLRERKITIGTQRLGNQAEISIADNGRGIPEEILERLFREPIKKSRGAKGQGMGLLFAQTIVQTYGGGIRCSATGPSGTTMTITLPLET